MALFAGILSRTERPPDPQVVRELLAALGRSGDEPRIHRDRRIVLARIEPSGLDAPDLLEGPPGVTAGAGHPFLGHATARDDFAALAPELAAGRVEPLTRCRGQFALAHWSPDAARLVLATDFVGLRPLYVYVGGEWVAFATALRVLEAITGLPLEMDLLGTTEEICFGYPLGDRTPYTQIRRLRSGEAWIVDAAGIRRTSYARMDDVAEAGSPLDKLVDEAYEHFVEAVRLRAGDRPEALAFLSGGLDSRCVVAALVGLGKPVRCVNIVRPGRLDTTLARRFARTLGVDLFEQSVPEGELQPVSKGLAYDRLHEQQGGAAGPRLIFSGDGGSVGTGHEYLLDEHVRLLRAGDVAGAAAFALARRGRPSRAAFRRAVHERVTRALERSIERELRRLDGPAESGRKFHHFLMQNDQRRHLDHHFEELDRYRTELATPFFDTAYLRCILSVPVDACMRHAFYYRWLERFPAPVREVPWQAYRGHLPCPVPIDASDAAATQWEPDRREQWRLAQADFSACLASVREPALPAACGIGRGRTLAALLAHATGLANGVGLFRAANAYRRYLARSGGRMSDRLDEVSAVP